MEEVESSNFVFDWLRLNLDNIKGIIISLRNANEGCESITEFLEIPYNLQCILIPEIQYKNMKFLVLDLDILITNLSPILKERTKVYKESIKQILDIRNNRSMFLEDIRNNNNLIQIRIKPFFYSVIDQLSKIYSDLIMEKEISKLLFIEGDDKKW